MSLKITLFVTLLAVGSVLGRNAFRSGTCPKPTPPSTTFEVEKFTGLWYEIERSFEPFELEWDCATFDYTQVGEHLFKVDMNGIKSKKPVSHHGKATNNATTPYILTLTFGKYDIPDDQWIVEIDEEKGYALVLTCFNAGLPIQIDFAWIFSRTTTLDKQIVADLKKKLDSLGVASEILKPVNQKCLSMLEKKIAAVEH